MNKNYTVCHCQQVSYEDIVNALGMNDNYESVLSAFEHVQKITFCSTGCGGCRQKVMDIISEIIMNK